MIAVEIARQPLTLHLDDKPATNSFDCKKPGTRPAPNSAMSDV